MRPHIGFSDLDETGRLRPLFWGVSGDVFPNRSNIRRPLDRSGVLSS